ncbi:MAG TPA: ABC transporter permease [Candidatus Sulfomarinibacteraceae bacterium]|nr:ABC transporter permease [Candidatus Sulfomarinibacteraceae bacterium]
MQARRRVAFLAGVPTVYLLLFFLLPLAIMAVFSFRSGISGEAYQTFTLDNYRRFAQSGGFLRLLRTSALMSLAVSAVSVVLAYPLAYYLAFRAGQRRVLLLTLLIIPTWTSYLLRVFAWRLILGSNGILNSFLLWTGLIQEGSPILLYSRSAVVVTLIYVWVPFVALPIFAALERIDPGLLEASSDLGSPPWETFLRVTLPLSLPGVIAGFFFALIPTLGEYVTPLLVGGGQGAMYGNLIQDQFLRALNWPMGSVLSLAMLVAVIPLIIIFARYGMRSNMLEL